MTKSTYYFEINKVDAVKVRNNKLMAEIQQIFDCCKGRYGIRRVHRELVNRGYAINHKRVQRQKSMTHLNPFHKQSRNI